ncbi:aspartate--tRNA(Asn) ligase [Clostridium grantii]|uniref:Aspartate--tRNA ligase n=1 Tax=Clostridium grantii DSM 8605 TaxID=1121316 RepID=A0A1M5VMK7_9CLOT|nr:aspartate--tRNA(Asn) ligase [Clostridium grantii]SHH76482.1 nondiscriminating aspartyl-tRNA synthetase [Clostridium grantii DSM 8605]
MNRILMIKLEENIGKQVMIQGWLHKVKNLGKIAFLYVRDRSGIVQCVVNTKEIDIKGMRVESVIQITGEVTSSGSKTEKIEVQVISMQVLNKVNHELPMEVNKENIEASLDVMIHNRVLSFRNKKVASIFKVQECISKSFAEFLRKEGFKEIFTPKIVKEGTEGGTELFEVKYFNEKAYLAQSPQFYKQMMVSSGFERVFEIGHVYRAESHDTKRHINEFISLDLEMGFIKDEYELMELEEKLIEYMINNIKEECMNEVELLQVNLPIIGEEIPKMKLSEAIEILKTQYKKINLEKDIDPEGEKLISEYVKEKYKSDFVFLTHYPQEKRPMYTMPADNGETKSFDLIFRGLEITTGGQRIHNYEILKEKMIEKGLNPENFEGYLSAFKYGMPPHGGLAIGLERITASFLGIENVREATMFTRDKNRLVP